MMVLVGDLFKAESAQVVCACSLWHAWSNSACWKEQVAINRPL